jgi:hypothetical protein
MKNLIDLKFYKLENYIKIENFEKYITLYLIKFQKILK